MRSIKTYDLGYSDVYIFEHYLINQIKDNVRVNLDHVAILRKLINEDYGKEKLVYISNRVNNYTVDPLVYPEVGRITNLLGMAIVTEEPQSIRDANFEKVFYHKEFEIFDSFEKSIVWANKILKSSNLSYLY